MKLYEIADEMQAVLAQADPETGEITDAQCAALDALEMEFPRKVESVAMYIRTQEARAVAFKAERDLFVRKTQVATNQVARLKAYLMDCMGKVGARKIEGEKLTVNVQKSAPRLVVDAEDAIPEKYYVKQAPKLDQKAVKDAIKGGASIDGVHMEQGEHVRIR